MNAFDMLATKCIYTIDRQDGRKPQVFEACAFPLWSGLHDLLNIYYSGWVSCKCEMPTLGHVTIIHSVKFQQEAQDER